MAARGYAKVLEKLEHTRVLDLEDEGSFHIDVLPTPSTIVNAMTGVGGLPRGKMVEIFGPQGCGKTTFSLQMGALIQEEDPDAAMLFIDLEQTFDPNYAKALGVSMKNSRTTVVRPAFGEQAAQAALASILGNHHDLIVVDSLTTMNTKSFLTSETASIGARARLTSEFLSKILAAMAQSERQHPLWH